jgi:hypothetical protein
VGIVAGVCQEMGLAEYVDAVAGPSQQHVSVGTATVAMILNGLGFSNRRLYLVPPFFATKPVEHLRGPGITAALLLHDDCLGRALDWLSAQDPTTLFAGIARQARPRLGRSARHIHVDTTAFAVSGEYAAEPAAEQTGEEAEQDDAHLIAVPDGWGLSDEGESGIFCPGFEHDGFGICFLSRILSRGLRRGLPTCDTENSASRLASERCPRASRVGMASPNAINAIGRALTFPFASASNERSHRVGKRGVRVCACRLPVASTMTTALRFVAAR